MLMATIQPNTFTSYNMTLEEELSGSIFTLQQTQVLQNMLSSIAEEKLALEFDPTTPEVFSQAEAYKRGQLDLILYMLDRSETANKELNSPEHNPLKGE